MGLFDLDEGLAKTGDGRFEKELRKAKLHIFREEYDEAIAIYNAILLEDMEVLDAYIGLVRAYSKDFTVLEGERIDKNVRIISRMFDDVEDEEYLAFVKKKSSSKKDAEEKRLAAERKAAEEKTEAERRRYCVHANLGGRWADLILNDDGGGNYSLKNVELKRNYYFKVNLDGDWRGHKDLKLPITTAHNFSSDGTPDQNIRVLFDGVYNLYVSREKDKSGDFAGKSIWIERSDATLRAKEESELRKAEEERRKYHIYANLNGNWSKLVLNDDGNGNYSIKNLELKKGYYFKANLDGDWRGYPDLKLSVATRHNFRSDGTPNQNIRVISDGVYNLYVGREKDKFGDYVGKSIWIERSDATLRAEEEKRLAPFKPFLFEGNGSGTVKLTQLVDKNMTDVVIPEKDMDGNTVIEIYENVFKGCGNLRSVSIPRSVVCFGHHAFNYCRSLKAVTISNNTKTIGRFAFSGCSSLESFSVPGSVKIIEEKVFHSCESLTNLTIEKGVEKIEWCAFYKCTGLKNLTIPKSVTEISSAAFQGCKNLVIKVPRTAKVEKDSFQGCKQVIYY